MLPLLMNLLPVVSRNPELLTQLENALAEAGLAASRVVPFEDCGDALEYLTMDMPALYLLDFSDPALDMFGLLEQIAADPWLLGGGIIAISDGAATTRRIAEHSGANLLVTLSRRQLPRYLPMLLRLLHTHRRLLQQRGLGDLAVSTVGAHFEIENDGMLAGCYVNLVCNALVNAGLYGSGAIAGLRVTLTELLLNAIEHGNCEISGAEKRAWLERGEPLEALLAERLRTPRIAARRVVLEYGVNEGGAHFHIADAGSGFDWRKQLAQDVDGDPLALHGRGLQMAAMNVDLQFNEAGNAVRFVWPLDRDAGAEMRPQLFTEQAARDLAAGEVLFHQGDDSNDLYFIVSGCYRVQVDGTVISDLDADDLFVGEMSFLLNQPRSATIIAAEPGRLLVLERLQFVRQIRAHPHYAIYLARLLAQRLTAANNRDRSSSSSAGLPPDRADADQPAAAIQRQHQPQTADDGADHTETQ